jgi:hypothetical protein
LERSPNDRSVTIAHDKRGVVIRAGLTGCGKFESFERPESAPVSCHSRRAVFNRDAGSRQVRNILIDASRGDNAFSQKQTALFLRVGLVLNDLLLFQRLWAAFVYREPLFAPHN